MNQYLVYTCLFHDEKYIFLLDLLLESIASYCKNDVFDIIIYTSTALRNKILKQSAISNLFLNKKIIFHVNDYIQNKIQACSSRLDVFDFPQVKNYKRILYLDTDIIVQNSLEPIFRLIKEDKLYALKECDNILEFEAEYFGKSLFGNEINLYQDKSGFNSGVLLFKNSKAIKNLFQVIKLDMIKRKHLMFFYDQPFIIYNTKKLKLCNNTTLANYVEFSHAIDNYTDASIVHFSGGVKANYEKILAMRQYFVELNERKNNIYMKNIHLLVKEYLKL